MSIRNDSELDMALVNTVRTNKTRNTSSNPTYINQSGSKNRSREEAYGQRTARTEKNIRYSNGHNVNNSKRKRKKRRKKRKGLRVLFTVLVFLMIVAASLAAVMKYVPEARKYILNSCGGSLLKCVLPEDMYKNIYDSTFNEDDLIVNEGVDRSKFTGYYTIALFGIDSRDEQMDAGVNSDSIILVSINQDTGEVVMSSIYRDTWLSIPDDNGENSGAFRKINSAFCSGGVKSAINTLNTNFDLNITDYVTINFQGLATIIDMLGGLDMTITEEEVGYINGYLKENRAITGMDAPDVTEYGQVHMTGLQVAAYCRIRYCAFIDENGTQYLDDMGRTARQRYVMSLMIDKAKEAGVTRLLEIAEHVFSGEDNIIKTSIEYDQMMEMIPAFIDFKLGETKGFPFTYAYPDSYLTNGESAVAVAGLTYNVSKLHEFLYSDKDYQPSYRVRQIDEELYNLTGIGEIYLPEDKHTSQ